jgi:hypothetical protein
LIKWSRLGFALLIPVQIFIHYDRPYLTESLMDHNILEAIRAWLEPLPDQSLPPIELQEQMLTVLDRVSYFKYFTPSILLQVLSNFQLLYSYPSTSNKYEPAILERLSDST